MNFKYTIEYSVHDDMKQAHITFYYPSREEKLHPWLYDYYSQLFQRGFYSKIGFYSEIDGEGYIQLYITLGEVEHSWADFAEEVEEKCLDEANRLRDYWNLSRDLQTTKPKDVEKVFSLEC